MGANLQGAACPAELLWEFLLCPSDSCSAITVRLRIILMVFYIRKQCQQSLLHFVGRCVVKPENHPGISPLEKITFFLLARKGIFLFGTWK